MKKNVKKDNMLGFWLDSFECFMSYLGVCFTFMNHHLHCEFWKHLCAYNSVEKREKRQISKAVIYTNYPTDRRILSKCQLTFLWKEYSLPTLEGSADRPAEWVQLWAGEVGQPEDRNSNCYLSVYVKAPGPFYECWLLRCHIIYCVLCQTWHVSKAKKYNNSTFCTL